VSQTRSAPAPIPKFDAVHDVWLRGRRLQAVRDAAAAFKVATMLERGRPRQLVAAGREDQRPGCGGGILAVVLDFSVAGLVLDRAAVSARPGAAPLTILAQVRRPPVAAAFPFGPVGPYWTDDELVAEAREALRAPIGTLARHGRVDLELAFRGVEKATVHLLRDRDYTHVVIGSRTSARQRRQCRRVESAASPYCTVDVLQTASATSRWS
jgi:hypothetical protein